MERLKPEHTYHVFNRANGSEKIFITNEHCRYFLYLYHKHIRPIAHTYAFCLMPNHFHFLVKIKTQDEILEAYQILKHEKAGKKLPKFKGYENYLSKQFSNLFSAYTQAFNKDQNRMGSLFIKNFKRKVVLDDVYLLRLVQYIHRNPLVAGLCQKLEDWEYSSFEVLLLQNQKFKFLDIHTPVSWYHNTLNFRMAHFKDIELEFELDIA